MKLAVIGAGIAGNVAAYRLKRDHSLTVYEAAAHVGGHSETQSVPLGGRIHRVDTGFIAYNEREYPAFTRLLRELGVASQPTTMSFSVREDASGFEYNGSSINGLVAQRTNLLRPAFWRMIRDVLRFNRESLGLAASDAPDQSLATYLAERGYSQEFTDRYLIPMTAAIWSSDPTAMRTFPGHFVLRFLRKHGLLAYFGRPEWRVVCGGSQTYVERLTAGFRAHIRTNCPVESVRRAAGAVLVKARGLPVEKYDAAFIACHADQALAVLADADPLEREVLGAFSYRWNDVVLHTDERMLPRAPRARAAWNYHILDAGQRVAVTYDMRMLQSLDVPRPILVSLNRGGDIDAASVIKRLGYAHPQFTPAAVAAQARRGELNGRRDVYFCGAYWGYGFHEDGVVSADGAVAQFEADVSSARPSLARNA